MNITVQDMIRRLAAVEPLTVPAGEPGIVWRNTQDASGPTRLCVPVLSIYLDWRPQATGERPGARAARVVLRERLRQIERTLLPRGTALDSMRADAARIETYLDTQLDPASQGVAIFASAAQHLFETLAVETPFHTQVSAEAEPDLFQLARLLSSRRPVVIAVVDVHEARLFVTLGGSLREVDGLADDPKLYHMVHGENVMNQAHYQRHAGALRAQLAREVAGQIARLVDEEQASEVILAGHTAGMALVREALDSRIARMLREPLLALDVAAPREAIAEEVAPLLRAIEAERERSAVERLVEGVQADGLAVAGLEPTLSALQAGEVETVVLAEDAALPPETRSALIELATRTDAAVEVVEGGQGSEPLRQLGGVGALLRYRAALPLVGVELGPSRSATPAIQ